MAIIVEDQFTGEYFDDLNRGGLTVPSESVVQLGTHMFAIIQMLISKEYEASYLSHQYERHLLITLTSESVSSDPVLKMLMHDTCLCGTPQSEILSTLMSTLSNIFWNIYSKQRNDSMTAAKASSFKKQKLSNLQN